MLLIPSSVSAFDEGCSTDNLTHNSVPSSDDADGITDLATHGKVVLSSGSRRIIHRRGIGLSAATVSAPLSIHLVISGHGFM